MGDFTVEQMMVLEEQLKNDGYSSIEEWMEDSDYWYSEEAEEWFEDGNPDSEPFDPWTQYFWAKEAEREAIEQGYGIDIEGYRTAPSGIGPYAFTWSDKPHRLFYDALDEIEILRNKIRND